ncbi:MAG: O-antigen ligase family protein, partial [Elusimicrobia bacterium]|nr:O-antigen ligase family protein [Elusimicrobiota bacterium]
LAYFSPHREKYLKILFYCLPVFLILFIARYSFFLSVFNRFLSIFNLKEGDIVSRLQGYIATFQIFKLHPLIGRGPESFLLLFRRAVPAEFVGKIGPLAHAGYTHSYPLQILVDFGILGFGFYIFLLVAVLKRALISKDGMKIAAAAVIFAHFFTNLFAFPTVAEVFLFWFSAAVIFRKLHSSAHICSNPARKILFFASAVFFVLPAITDFLFVAGMRAHSTKKSYGYLKTAASLIPQDYHLMNIGRKYIEFFRVSDRDLWLKRARTVFERIADRNGANALAFNGLGVVWKEFYELNPAEKSFREAEKNFMRAIELDPFLRAGYLNLALLYEKRGFFENAAEIYKRALKIYPKDATMLFNFGVVSANAGHIRHALNIWKKLKKIKPDYPKLKKYIREAETILKKKNKMVN